MTYEENQISDQIDAGLVKQEEIYAEAMETKIPKEQWEKCPSCNNDGAIACREVDIDPDGNYSDNWYPEQCEFCYTNPKSVFNQKQLLKGTDA